jgi:hypothetical protein
MRRSTFAAALVLGSLAGCHHAGSSGGGAPPPIPPAPAPVKALADPLAYLPADADYVVTIDARAIGASPLWAAHGAKPRAALAELRKQLPSTCPGGLPITGIAVAGSGPSAGGDVVLVVRGLPRRCLESDPRFQADHGLFTVTAARPVLIEFVDDDTAVLATGPRASRARLDELIAGSSSAGFPVVASREIPGCTATTGSSASAALTPWCSRSSAMTPSCSWVAHAPVGNGSKRRSRLVSPSEPRRRFVAGWIRLIPPPPSRRSSSESRPC